MQQLSPLDASFLALETRHTPMHIAGLSIYDPSTAKVPLTFDLFLEHIGKRIHLAKSFTQRLVEVPLSLDHPYWIDDAHFDLEYHVRHSALPRPGTHQQMMTLFGRLMSLPLDKSRPLWEMYYIEGLDAIDGIPKGAFAVISKVHHAVIDGVSGVELSAAIHDLTPDTRQVPPPKESERASLPTDVQMLFKTGFQMARQPLKMIRAARHVVTSAVKVGAALGLKKIPPPSGNLTAPRTRFNVAVTSQRTIDGALFDLGEIKQVKNAVEGATVNDVVLAICSGAIRRYLDELGELPDRPLVAFAPVSVRSKDSKGEFGNQISAMLVSLATGIDDPVERLEVIHESAVKSKAYQHAIGGSVLTDLSEFVPAVTFTLASRLYTSMELANRHDPLCTGIFTNVPGPQFPMYLAGAKQLRMYGSGTLIDGIGLIVVIFSYNGTLSITATSTREIVADGSQLARYFSDAFEELKRAVFSPKRKKPKAAKKTSARGPAKATVKSRSKSKAGPTAKSAMKAAIKAAAGTTGTITKARPKTNKSAIKAAAGTTERKTKAKAKPATKPKAKAKPKSKAKPAVKKAPAKRSRKASGAVSPSAKAAVKAAARVAASGRRKTG